MMLRSLHPVSSCAFLIALTTAVLGRTQPAADPLGVPQVIDPARANAPSSSATAAPTIAPSGTTGDTASASTAVPSPGPAPVRSASTQTCTEHLPDGKARPEVVERFPAQGYSGHAAVLEVRVRHGRGERVLPGALEVQTDSDAAKALTRAGFVLPDPKGPGRPRIERHESEHTVQSVVRIPVVPLPSEAGRHELVLPSLPIAMARASGEVVTVCTAAHPISVEDPTANHPHAEPKTNPGPRRQRELWEGLRNATYGGAAGLLLAFALAVAYRWWRRRPRPVPPPPPPRPAWVVALEALHDIRHARLVEQGRLDIHLERVSNTLRVYLGDRYGFDGLECTTDEIVAQLAQRSDAATIREGAQALLREADLVKFADVEPEATQCVEALATAERIVRDTTPSSTLASPPGSPSGERAS